MRALRPIHWAGRFFSSIRPGRPPAGELSWVSSQLSAEEAVLFGRMSNPDQRHSIAVARRAEPALEAIELDADRRRAAITAALLHDVGKSIAGLRTYGRVAATLAGALAGHDMADAWQQTSGFTRRVGLYLNYPRLGAELLELHGSDPWVVAWAAEHHDEASSLPEPVAAILRAADR